MLLIPNPDRRLHLILWSVVVLVGLWSFQGCHDRFTWFMESVPVLIGTVALAAYYPYFRFTRLVCWLLAIHAVILLVGGHYTYALVPLGDWVKDAWHLSRNHYDRLGHFMQGFVPAMISREILIRRGILKRGAWLNFIVICICLAFSATYELIEWQAAIWTGTRADAFLGTQGDPWDTQEDMAMALIGAITAFLFLATQHDKQLQKLR